MTLAGWKYWMDAENVSRWKVSRHTAASLAEPAGFRFPRALLSTFLFTKRTDVWRFFFSPFSLPPYFFSFNFCCLIWPLKLPRNPPQLVLSVLRNDVVVSLFFKPVLQFFLYFSFTRTSVSSTSSSEIHVKLTYFVFFAYFCLLFLLPSRFLLLMCYLTPFHVFSILSIDIALIIYFNILPCLSAHSFFFRRTISFHPLLGFLCFRLPYIINQSNFVFSSCHFRLFRSIFF